MTSFDDFVGLVSSAGNRKLVEDLLRGVTTSHERRALTRRVEIIKRLQAGDNQHEIAEYLKVGVATVTRWAKEMDRPAFKALKKSPKR